MKTRKSTVAPDIGGMLQDLLIGQPEAISAVVPFVNMYQAGLSPEGRPAGVFLLLGPSGTGKTKTVEALAHVLHGSERSVLKIDCGEFQMEHEVAKLIGAPPGYLGHMETRPILSQSCVNSVTSEHSGLSIVLFDEIEKAAPSLIRVLLGVLDKATLRLGDNCDVNFERSLIFMTSNLGTKEMRQVTDRFGFACDIDTTHQVRGAGLQAVRKAFPSEFVNRIDAVVVYNTLTGNDLVEILKLQLASLTERVRSRCGYTSFEIRLSDAAYEKLLAVGTSSEYGARELKRAIQKLIINPIVDMVLARVLQNGSMVSVSVSPDGELKFKSTVAKTRSAGV